MNMFEALVNLRRGSAIKRREWTDNTRITPFEYEDEDGGKMTFTLEDIEAEDWELIREWDKISYR